MRTSTERMTVNQNNYKQAVDFIEDYIKALDSVLDNPDLTGIESKIKFALTILKAQYQYNGLQ